MKNWALKLFTLLLITGIGAVLLHPIRPQAKGDQTLQAKAVKSGPSAKSSISQSVSNTTMSSPEEHFQKEISSSGEVERLSYASRQGWIEDTRHENPEGDFKNVVIHRVFTERGDETPHYTSTHIADEIILSTETPLSDENISDIEEEYNVKLLRKLIVPNTYQFRLAEVSLEKLVQTRASLEKHLRVTASEFNGIHFPSMVPDDPYFAEGLMWGLQNTGKLKGQDGTTFLKDLDSGALKVWEKHTDCSSVPVAVLDTGVDFNHPELSGVVDTMESRNFTSNDPNDFSDSDSHGTHVAGTIGALGNNALGIAGICWKSRILSLRVLGPNGGTTADIGQAMVYFAKSSAKVANMSLGSSGPPPQIYINAMKEVEKADKLIIASAGNNNVNVDQTNRPIGNIDSDHIIVVAAMDGNGKKATFSNFGIKNVDIAAPGVQIWSTVPKGTAGDYRKAYAAKGGTSMATPHVTGAVALIWSYAPSLDAKTIRKIFFEFATELGHLNSLAAEGRVLNLSAIPTGIAPGGKISEALKSIELKQSNSFEIPISIVQNYVKIKTIEIMDGDISIGMAEMVGEKIKVFVPNTQDQLQIRLKITDVDGRVHYSDAIPLKADRTKSALFDQIEVDGFLGDVSCQLAEQSKEGETILLFDRKVISKDFCQKLCRMMLPMVHSTKAQYICGETL